MELLVSISFNHNVIPIQLMYPHDSMKHSPFFCFQKKKKFQCQQRKLQSQSQQLKSPPQQPLRWQVSFDPTDETISAALAVRCGDSWKEYRAPPLLLVGLALLANEQEATVEWIRGGGIGGQVDKGSWGNKEGTSSSSSSSFVDNLSEETMLRNN